MEKFNRWYKDPNSKWMVFITSEKTGYGFNTRGDWIIGTSAWSDEVYNYQEPSEILIKQRLLKEAKRRFPKGIKFKSAYNKKNGGISKGDLTFGVGYNICCRTDNGILTCFYNGKWANIAELPKKEFPEKWCLEINSLSGEQYDKVYDWYHKGDDCYSLKDKYIIFDRTWGAKGLVSNFQEITYNEFFENVYKPYKESLPSEYMIPGEVYYLKTKYGWIIRFKEFKNGRIEGNFYIDIYSTYVGTDYVNDIKLHKLIRKATSEEVVWLETCEEFGKFIPKEKVIADIKENRIDRSTNLSSLNEEEHPDQEEICKLCAENHKHEFSFSDGHYLCEGCRCDLAREEYEEYTKEDNNTILPNPMETPIVDKSKYFPEQKKVNIHDLLRS